MRKKRPSILIIDDQPANLKVLLSLLKENGFEVRIAENGERALKVLAHHHPDIVLLDVMMPGMDGFTTCRRMKDDEKTRDIPVIFMTALDSLEDKVAGFEAGGVDYITKPFQQVEVLARIRTHYMLKKQQDELEAALAEVKKLSGIIPICSVCKQIRNEKGYWQQVEQYIAERSTAQFSHALCQKCADQLYGDQDWYQKKKEEG